MTVITEQMDQDQSRTSLLRTTGLGRARSPIDRSRHRVHRVLAAPESCTYGGLIVAALGAVLVAVGWGATAGETNVALQLPYVVSAGITGLALVIVGMTIVSIGTQRADAALDERQNDELLTLLIELREMIEEQEL